MGLLAGDKGSATRSPRRGRAIGLVAVALAGTGVLAALAFASGQPGTSGSVTYKLAVGAKPGPVVATAKCGNGKHVVGGGFISFTQDGMGRTPPTRDSKPVDGADANHLPDDGWQTRTTDPDPTAKTAAWAMCVKKADFLYVTKKANQVGKNPKLVKAKCSKRRHVFGGGAETQGGFQAIKASFPFDSGDRGARPDDGWAVATTSSIASKHRVKAFAICGKAMPAYRVDSRPGGVAGTLEPGSGSTFAALCPSNRHVSGVGGRFDGSRAHTTFDRSVPDDFADSDDVADDRADSFFLNDLGGSMGKKAHSYAVCIK